MAWQFPSLSIGQLNLIAGKYGIAGRRSMIDIGCGEPGWIQQQATKGRDLRALINNAELADAERVIAGSPAATIPFEAHAADVVLIDGTRELGPEADFLEMTIALANLGSCVKPRGVLLVPTVSDEMTQVWQQRFAPFPVSMKQRELSGGLMAVLTLAKLFGRDYKVNVLEFRVQKKPLSRLEWHRLAHAAVMQHQNSASAA